MLIGCALSFRPAQAGYIVTLTQQGSNVVATGGGTIDLTGLTLFSTLLDETVAIVPVSGFINTGPAPATLEADTYQGFLGPASFGAGGPTLASGGSGDLVGVSGDLNYLFVPRGYVSGSSLSDSATYANKTFSSLGVNPGTYVWTWGSGAHADNFTLQIGADPVPEPSGALLLAPPLGIGMILAARRRRITRPRLA
jgi:hypothetical protein